MKNLNPLYENINAGVALATMGAAAAHQYQIPQRIAALVKAKKQQRQARFNAARQQQQQEMTVQQQQENPEVEMYQKNQMLIDKNANPWNYQQQ